MDMGFQVIAIMGIFIVPIFIGILMSKKSKKASMIWFSIPFIFVVGVLLWWVYEINDRFITDTDLASEQIEPFVLLENMDRDTLEAYGTFEEEENQVFESMYVYDDFSLGVNAEEELTYIEVRDKDFETAHGIQVGDPIERVEELYGSDTYTTKEAGIGISKNYVDRNHERHIKFFEKDGVVTQITFYKK